MNSVDASEFSSVHIMRAAAQALRWTGVLTAVLYILRCFPATVGARSVTHLVPGDNSVDFGGTVSIYGDLVVKIPFLFCRRRR
jgi:hypothetical protein